MSLAKSVLEGKKHIIFDLDDTLIDCYESHKSGVYRIHKFFNNLSNKKINFYQKLLNYMDKNGRNHFARIVCFELFAPSGTKVSFETFDSVYWEGVGQYIKLFSDVLQALPKLNSQFDLSILTNGGNVQHKKLKLLVDSSGSFHFRDMIVTGDFGKYCYKPNPYCLDFMISNFKEKKENCIYVGDSIEKDKAMCDIAGVDFLLIDRFKRCDDYDGLKISNLLELI